MGLTHFDEVFAREADVGHLRARWTSVALRGVGVTGLIERLDYWDGEG